MRFTNQLFTMSFFVSLLLVILLTFPASMVAQEAVVDDETCLDCHEEYDRSLASSSHRLVAQTDTRTVQIRCVSCHRGAELHVEDPSTENIGNPASLIGFDVIEICSQCHSAHSELDNYGFDAHTVEQLNCSECHKVHTFGTVPLLDERAEFCFGCHQEKRANFLKNSNHPVLQQNVTCLSCHQFTKRQDQNLAYELSSHCRDCHPEQGGPFLFEHEAVNAYSVEGSGCIECHDPHGSENNRLMRQPGNQLCRQCHFPAGHTAAHGGIWAAYDCQICHTETHGSFVSNLYLDPNLPAKLGGSCYNPGCHSLNR
ncbi:MAG: hypothetical protein GTO51_08455 [Candidatus Latescibacteria bacterium]|nr:hypothetical protein [Candidatus Latescibacterota bacterium]NIM21984.1 hypothetical protein [Candidatus Latescibacterota bacterium]NIM66002.1 hypothetical protein [Candidatus Latescibacterota bacterium]NIO02410.1 hypothetical protein [Candidatus Latescibacterota bacterium]NIO29321.1 hypothetical protein [Candidatus Latescibacterota bacterium]